MLGQVYTDFSLLTWGKFVVFKYRRSDYVTGKVSCSIDFVFEIDFSYFNRQTVFLKTNILICCQGIRCYHDFFIGTQIL